MLDTFTKATGQNSEHFRARLGLALARVQRKDLVGDAETIIKEVMAREAELSPPQKARAMAIGAAILKIQLQHDLAITTADGLGTLSPPKLATPCEPIAAAIRAPAELPHNE